MFDGSDEWGGLGPPKDMVPSRFWTERLPSICLGMLGLGVLLGLLMPAVSTHCRRSPQLQCLSNIRQMGLGISAYTYQEHQFPPGTIPNDDLPIGRRPGWGVAILPHLDEASYLPDRGKSPEEAAGLAWDDPVFADLAARPPGITHCPTSTPGATSYAAVAGLGVDAPTLPTAHRRAGVFGDDRVVTPADIKDGASTTMMLVESSSCPGPWFAGGRRTVRGLDPARQPYLGQGRPFGGNHDGGTCVLFADGSARIVSDSVAPRVFEALSTIGGGEKVSDGWEN